MTSAELDTLHKAGAGMKSPMLLCWALGIAMVLALVLIMLLRHRTRRATDEELKLLRRQKRALAYETIARSPRYAELLRGGDDGSFGIGATTEAASKKQPHLASPKVRASTKAATTGQQSAAASPSKPPRAPTNTATEPRKQAAGSVLQRPTSQPAQPARIKKTESHVIPSRQSVVGVDSAAPTRGTATEPQKLQRRDDGIEEILSTTWRPSTVALASSMVMSEEISRLCMLGPSQFWAMMDVWKGRANPLDDDSECDPACFERPSGPEGPSGSECPGGPHTPTVQEENVDAPIPGASGVFLIRFDEVPFGYEVEEDDDVLNTPSSRIEDVVDEPSNNVTSVAEPTDLEPAENESDEHSEAREQASAEKDAHEQTPAEKDARASFVAEEAEVAEKEAELLEQCSPATTHAEIEAASNADEAEIAIVVEAAVQAQAVVPCATTATLADF